MVTIAASHESPHSLLISIKPVLITEGDLANKEYKNRGQWRQLMRDEQIEKCEREVCYDSLSH